MHHCKRLAAGPYQCTEVFRRIPACLTIGNFTMELSSCGRSREACLFCCDGPKKVRIFFRGEKKRLSDCDVMGMKIQPRRLCVLSGAPMSHRSLFTAPAKSHTQPNLEQWKGELITGLVRINAFIEPQMLQETVQIFFLLPLNALIHDLFTVLWLIF